MVKWSPVQSLEPDLAYLRNSTGFGDINVCMVGSATFHDLAQECDGLCQEASAPVILAEHALHMLTQHILGQLSPAVHGSSTWVD